MADQQPTPRLWVPPGSAVGALIAALDGNTPLGPPAGWHPTLVRTLNMMLAARTEIVLFWGPDYVALYNDDYAPTIGVKHPAALGRPAREYWAELWDDLRPMLDRVLHGGEAVSAKDRPFYIERAGYGEEVCFDISYSPVREDDGAIGGVLCLVTDTTQRVRAERRAHADRDRLAQMFEQAPSFMAVLREPGHVFELANAAHLRLVGGREVVGLTLQQALPELAEQGVADLLDEVVASGKPFSGRAVPLRLRGVGGKAAEHLLDVICQPMFDDQGRVTGIFVEGNDVSERVRAEAQLTLSRSSLELAADVAEIGTWDVDLVARTVDWSDRTRAMFGIAPGVAVTLEDFFRGVHPDDLADARRALSGTLDPHQAAPYDVEFRTIGREDNVVRWLSARGRGFFDPHTNACIRAIGTVLDITPRKLQQEALRESEQRFRTLADSAPALIWMCDQAGALIFANHWHEEMFGRAIDELMGGGWQQIIHPDDRAAFSGDFDRAFAAREPFTRDVRVIDRHGEVRWLHCEARPRYTDDHFVGYVGCDVDTTDVHLASEGQERAIAERTRELAATNRQLSAQMEERERVEATLRQMQRLEAIGQLTSGVAHDFNNLLTVVLGNVDLVTRAAEEAGLDERTRKRLGYIRTAAERGAALTAQLLAFSRRQRLEARPIDLNGTVAGMRDLLQSSMGGSVKLDTRLRPDLWLALVDPTQIELIILNLAINARDAMEVGGSLTVETDNVTLGPPRRPEEPAPGDYVLIAVTDTGSGMPPAVLERAFEPFFTTKPVGKGSGLGLPQVYGFAKQSGGGVAIETEEERGTSVRVYLPRAQDRRRVPRVGPNHAAPDQDGDVRGRCVLVVDDDAPVREITAAVLRGLGAEVVEAGSGGSALEWLTGKGGECDMMVVDFAMPGMNGAELAAAVAKRWPDIMIVYATGYADLTAIAGVSEERIVQKPFLGGELQRKVARLLNVRVG
ncbi:PAS domain S-box protein [uncultured Sphingomonas sp.]|uniref:hybrid sensor histidine kinase/response regulator n=1 Tax=uncultured Sphingomonas sp. TaxID=158754 RepID=UPI0025CCDA45|nr:PAS domain S-box protein [uncultured Sphingomonas sp.]